eukprot:5535833-Prymnesium_polylepis.1
MHPRHERGTAAPRSVSTADTPGADAHISQETGAARSVSSLPRSITGPLAPSPFPHHGLTLPVPGGNMPRSLIAGAEHLGNTNDAGFAGSLASAPLAASLPRSIAAFGGGAAMPRSIAGLEPPSLCSLP